MRLLKIIEKNNLDKKIILMEIKVIFYLIYILKSINYLKNIMQI